MNEIIIELLKNIGLGLFINSLYTILNLDFKPQAIYISVFSICLIIFCVYFQRRIEDGE